jgi:hypothetical protein
MNIKQMKKEMTNEINKIVDTLITVVNTKECATIFGMSQAIIKHYRFIAYVTEHSDIYVEVTRNENGEIIELSSNINFKQLVEKRVRWNLRNRKDENGFPIFYCFTKNVKTKELKHLPIVKEI